MLNAIPMRVDEATDVSELYAKAYSSKVRKKENGMRTVMAGNSGDDGPGRDGR
jgi:hypothetical protein